MLKPLQTVCLAATGLLVIGIVMISNKGEGGSTGQQQAQTQTPAATALPPFSPFNAVAGQNPIELTTLDLLALQQTKTNANDGDRGASMPDAGWIGVMLEDDKAHGLRVKDVFPGGPAAFAGLRVGDILLKVGDTAPDSHHAAAAAIEHLAPKKQASLTIQRGKQTLKLKIQAESLAEFHGQYAREMMRRDPRDPKYTEHHGISDADMSIEVVRRLFEQNQRLETKMQQVLEEVHALRTQLRGLSK